MKRLVDGFEGALDAISLPDNATAVGGAPVGVGYQQRLWDLRDGVARGYQAVNPLIFWGCAGFVAIGMTIWRPRDRYDAAICALVFGTALLVPVRCAILGVVDATSFPAVYAGYLKSAYLPMSIAGVMMLARLCARWRSEGAAPKSLAPGVVT